MDRKTRGARNRRIQDGPPKYPHSANDDPRSLPRHPLPARLNRNKNERESKGNGTTLFCNTSLMQYTHKRMDSIVSMRGENDGLALKFSLHTHGCLLRGPKRHSLSPSRTPVRLCVVSTVLGTVVPTAGTMPSICLSCNEYVNGWNFRAYLSLIVVRRD